MERQGTERGRKRDAWRRAARLVALALAAGAVLATAGCASLPTAGTGDVAFRLLWEGQSDLDLHVVGPDGEHLFFGNRASASGGLLDVDCNGGTGQLCARPIENVFWPVGAAPDGDYELWVRAHSVIPAEAPVEARLLVLEGSEVVAERRALLRANGQRLGPYAVSFAGGAGTGPITPGGDPDRADRTDRPYTPPPRPPASDG